MRVEGGDPTLLVNVEVRRADLRRISRADNLAQAFVAGRISGRDFERRVSGWKPVTVTGPPELAGRWRFVSDPDAVLALAQVAEDEEVETWIDSGRSRPLPRRRRPRR